MADNYYVIAEVDNRKPGESNSALWPKILAYSFESKKIFLSEGCGHGQMGGAMTLTNFSPSDWSDFFNETCSQWFKQLISDGTISSLKSEKQLIDLLNKNSCALKTMVF